MIRKCTRCRLSESRNIIVNGSGRVDSKIVLIGEAPGASEDAEGKPFVGRAGRFLDAVLEKVGAPRETLFVTNVVKCRPPGNRRPREDEISACHPHLIRELERIKPRIIVTLGAVALSALMDAGPGLRDQIGKQLPLRIDDLSAVVVPNYHPAAAMRNRRMRADFEVAMSKAVSLAR